MLINDHIIHIFDLETVFSNCIKANSYKNHYSLIRAIKYCKMSIYKENLKIGDDIIMETEYYRYNKNMLIIIDEDDKQYYQLIVNCKVSECTDNIDSHFLTEFFRYRNITVIDSVGNLLNISNIKQLKEFINKTKDIRNVFNSRKDLYHKYMNKLYDYRKIRDNVLNNYAGNGFNKLLKLADIYASELRDLCTENLDLKLKFLKNKYFVKFSKKTNNINLFGLYLAVLKAYKQSDINQPTDYFLLDYIIYLNFLKEFNAFISNKKYIIREYFKYYNLRNAERNAIKRLLKMEHLNGEDWLYGSSELKI